MITPEELRQHAAECRRMARFTRDKADKERWIHLADQWILAAEIVEHQNLNPGQPRLPQQLPH